MKHLVLALATIGGLSGCATILVATPQAARLSDQTLTIVLNTGEVCRTQWREAPEGDLCGFRYVVTEVDKPNLLRQVFTGLTTALGAEGAVPPQGMVVLTSAAGQNYRFISPPPVDLND